MQRMVRKQIYIGKNQDKALKRAARACGVSQAEMIRRGIRIGVTELEETTAGNDLVWKKAMRVMRKRTEVEGTTETQRTWKREDLYDR